MSNSGKSPFTPPTVDEVAEYISLKGLRVDAAHFVDYYAAIGWQLGSRTMRDWRAALHNWSRRESKVPSQPQPESRPVYHAL